MQRPRFQLILAPVVLVAVLVVPLLAWAQPRSAVPDPPLLSDLDAQVQAVFAPPGWSTPVRLPLRCATPVVRAAQDNPAVLSPASLDLLARSLASLAKDAQSHVSPAGHFIVNYETDGPSAVPAADDNANGVPDYVEWVAEAFEESWSHEVDVLGYTRPFLGSQRYRVDLVSMNSYGLTRRDTQESAGTAIQVNSDFAGFYRQYPELSNQDPQGNVRGGIRVTAAHELKHAIQYTETSWQVPAGWLEQDATWIEDIVFDQVNDYYNYLIDERSGYQSQFVLPSRSLNVMSYEGCTWQHFLSQSYGNSLIREYWQRRSLVLGTEGPARSFAVVLGDRDVDFDDAWARYGAWTYLSGDRARVGEGFEEAVDYPTGNLADPEATWIPWEGAGSLRMLALDLHRLDTAAMEGIPRFDFRGDAAVPWGVSLVLHTASGPEIYPVNVTAGVGLLVIVGRDLSQVDAAAVVVGNAYHDTSVLVSSDYDFTLSPDGGIAVDPALAVGVAPNPFRSQARVDYTVVEAGVTEIALFDLRGRRVRSVLGEFVGPGQQTLFLEGVDDSGLPLAAGRYVLQVRNGGAAANRLVTILR